MTKLYTYQLKFQDDGAGSAKTLEFQASDASEALIIAAQEAADRSAELWQSGKRLCRISRDDNDVWLVELRQEGEGTLVPSNAPIH